MNTMHPDRLRIEDHLRAIARPRDCFQNPGNLRAVQEYIEKELLSYGYKLIRQPFEFRGQNFENVITQTETDKALIIGAHFDAVPGTRGADDNASGVAGMLEAARLLADLKRTDSVRFIAFNAEEYGMMGSQFYVNSLTTEQRKAFAGMVSLEMIGFTSSTKGSQRIPTLLKPFYPDTGDFVALVGDSGAKRLLRQAQQSFLAVSSGSPALKTEVLTVPFKGKMLPEVRLSDHSPFWDADLPALLITDTSFFRNPHYHTDQDSIETLDLNYLGQITEGVVRLALTQKG